MEEYAKRAVIKNEIRFRRVDCQLNSEPISRDDDSFIPLKRKNRLISVTKFLIDERA